MTQANSAADIYREVCGIVLRVDFFLNELSALPADLDRITSDLLLIAIKAEDEQDRKDAAHVHEGMMELREFIHGLRTKLEGEGSYGGSSDGFRVA